MSPKSFIQFHQEGRKILWFQVICPDTDIQEIQTIWIFCTNAQGMSPKSFVQFHQEGTEILWVQVRCLKTETRQGNRET